MIELNKIPDTIPANNLAALSAQLVQALENEKLQKPREKDTTPFCPRCTTRRRIYCNGILTAYCSECRKAVNRERYAKIKARVTGDICCPRCKTGFRPLRPDGYRRAYCAQCEAEMYARKIERKTEV